jgi:Ca-activated chloride channel family protein
MLLRGSEYLKEGSADQIINLAKTSKGNDEEGYRSEFITLVKTSMTMLSMRK